MLVHMKRLVITTAAAAVVALGVTASPAAADVTVTSIVCADSSAKGTWVPAGTNGDKNLNGAVCLKGKKGTDELFLLTTTMAGTSGGCPAGSNAVQAIYAPGSYDANGTGIVCFNPSGKGSWSDDAYVLTSLTFG
jgi:hypothetical protein